MSDVLKDLPEHENMMHHLLLRSCSICSAPRNKHANTSKSPHAEDLGGKWRPLSVTQGNCHTRRTKHATSSHTKAALQFLKRPLVYLRKSLRLDSSWPGRWMMMGSLCVCPWRRCGALASRTALWARSEPEFAYRDTSASSSSCSSLEKNTKTQEMFFIWRVPDNDRGCVCIYLKGPHIFIHHINMSDYALKLGSICCPSAGWRLQ